MINKVIKKEILENIHSFKFVVITLLSVILVLTSIFVMYRDYQLRLENYEILRPTSSQESDSPLHFTKLCLTIPGGQDRKKQSCYKPIELSFELSIVIVQLVGSSST